MPAAAFKLSRAAFVLASLGSLGACGPDVNQFPPVCPSSAILADAADLTRYDGRGRDLTDLVLSGRITGFTGSCHAPDPGTLAASISVGIDLMRGPAAPGRDTQIQYFVAVTREQTILDKKVFATAVTFPANTDKIHIQGDPVALTMPTPDGLSGAAYKIIIGFQLTPEELDANRAPRAR